MSGFAFVGRLPASKSIINRLLIVKSHFPDFDIRGDSQADDVRFMRQAIAALNRREVIQVGSAGTVLRFMALRAARIPGRHRLQGHPRLFARPQEELLKILRQLGIATELGSDFLQLEGSGWCMQGDTLLVPLDKSSQFASAILLNAWNLPQELFVSLGGQQVSSGYWRMTTRLVQDLGMRLDFWDSDFRVPARQVPSLSGYSVEPDLSSAFALAAVAAVSGQATILDFPENSIQPDAAFVAILEAMGVHIRRSKESIKIERAKLLNGVAVNLRSTPDLFPVLAALCALAEGESDLFGAPHLVYKESNRLMKTAELLRAVGREVELKEDGLCVRGHRVSPPGTKFSFDCDHDHRLAFAAAVLKAAGFSIEIQHPEVVSKSFPEFWSILGWHT